MADKDQAEGRVKEGIGKLTGDEDLEAEGAGQGAWGDAKDTVGDAADDVKDKADDAWDSAMDKADDLKDRS